MILQGWFVLPLLLIKYTSQGELGLVIMIANSMIKVNWVHLGLS